MSFSRPISKDAFSPVHICLFRLLIKIQYRGDGDDQGRGEYFARNLKLDPDGGQKLFPNPNFARRQRRRASEKLGFIFKKRCKN